ncbi:hypothetical protein LRB82_05250 [Borreliella burgdorferi]|uniref:hypothetical protein n=1 Tax=Borreliella burgdorferi TaxID=139 RepID=UPI001E57C82F|nr:hypothetical protein [Borreliella burgdorferi]MCD2387500.1 hypothetical protein [Borreliella burgdorferi]
MLLLLEGKEKILKAMKAKIQKLHVWFLNSYKSEFKNLNDANKNTLMQFAKEPHKKLKGYLEGLGDILFGHIDKWMPKSSTKIWAKV